jgi:hypothetical protein
MEELPESKGKFIQSLRKEISELRKCHTVFGKFNAATPAEDMGMEDIGLEDMAASIQQTAPQLYDLLKELMKPYNTDTNAEKREEGHSRTISCICAMVAFAGAPRSSDQFPSILGVHLHAMGAKRQVINVLHGLGLVPSYQTIHERYNKLAVLGKVNVLDSMG